ncbi:MAG TPA: T9SS type A sorting domain-containing protein [Bacteroidia bacterium]|nr:T9SS type A sorting domain-containing protein [Bacteroidia bacterium]
MKLLRILFAVLISVGSIHGQSNLYLRTGNPVNEYHRVPFMFSTQLQFSGVVDNIGDSAAANVQVVARVYNSASVIVYTDSSAITPILNAGDSLLFTIPPYQVLPVIDKYTIEFIAILTNVDSDLSDNDKMLRDTFYVTDSVFARDNDNAYVSVATSGNGGGFLGQQFVLTQPAMLTSISGYLFSPQPCNVAFVLFSYNNGVPGYVPLATSDTFSLGAYPLWTTFSLLNGPVYLGADTFVIAAQQFSSVFIDLSLSDGHYTPGSTWVKWPSLGGWENIEIFGSEYAYPFMLRANLSDVTSVEDSPADNLSLAIFPNPVKESVVITTNGSETIEITNALGQVVYSVQATGTSTTVDVREFEAGVYFVSVYSEGAKATGRLVIE